MRSHDREGYAGGSLLLVWPSMPDSSKMMTKTKMDSLVLRVWGVSRGANNHTL